MAHSKRGTADSDVDVYDVERRQLKSVRPCLVREIWSHCLVDCRTRSKDVVVIESQTKSIVNEDYGSLEVSNANYVS